ncbi:Cdc13 [Kluyveromyces lactis]|nr:Cdc13 [Kluyveromyces lactis]
MEKYPYEYIPGPECLNKYYQHGSIVSKPVHFISILSKVVYTKNDKCLFHFDNFTNGKAGLNTYCGKIKNKSFECDVLLRMVLSSLFEKLGMQIAGLDYSSDFVLEELEKRYMGIISVKGLFITAYDKASLQIHELKLLDLKSYFAQSTADEYKLLKPSIEKLFRNLLKREKRNVDFQFKSLSSYCNEMQSYLDSMVLQEVPSTRLLPKENTAIVNPLFQLGLQREVNNDSFNEFDSQTQQHNIDTLPLQSISSNPDGEAGQVAKETIKTAIESDTPQSSSLEQNPCHDSIIHTGKEQKRSVGSNKDVSTSDFTSSGAMKKIKLTDLGALAHHRQVTRQDLDISSYQLPYDPIISSQSQFEQPRTIQEERSDPFDLKPDSISKAITDRLYHISDGKILGFIPNHYLDPETLRIEDDFLLIYVYTYELPLLSAVFVPEYNCYEIAITNVAKFFSKIGVRSYPRSIKNSLLELKELIDNNRYDITIYKKEFTIGTAKSSKWALKDVTFRSALPTPRKVTFTENKFPLVRVSNIFPSTNSKYYTVIGLAVTVKYTGGKTLVLSFTDFTANSKVNYGYDSFLGSFQERIPENEHVHALIYLNRVESLNQKLQSIIKMGLMECADKGNSNITHRSIIFKFTVKCQLFQGKLNTVILDADPITPTTPVTTEEYKLLKPLRNKIFKRMPSEVIQLYMLTMSRFLPISKNRMSQKPELLQEQAFYDSAGFSEDLKEDSIAKLENQLKREGVDKIEEDAATRPIELFGTRNPKTVDITDIKNNVQMDHNDIKVSAKILSIVDNGNNVTIYLTRSGMAGTQSTIDNPFEELLKVQIWGRQNLTLFFGNPNYSYNREELTACIGSIVDFTLIPRVLRVNEYLYIKIWCPIYATLESLLIHSRLEYDNDTLKYENFSDID